MVVAVIAAGVIVRVAVSHAIAQAVIRRVPISALWRIS
jgi:hypothetical protein